MEDCGCRAVEILCVQSMGGVLFATTSMIYSYIIFYTACECVSVSSVLKHRKKLKICIYYGHNMFLILFCTKRQPLLIVDEFSMSFVSLVVQQKECISCEVVKSCRTNWYIVTSHCDRCDKWVHLIISDIQRGFQKPLSAGSYSGSVLCNRARGCLLQNTAVLKCRDKRGLQHGV